MKLGRWRRVDPSQVTLLLGMDSNPLELPMNAEFINTCQAAGLSPGNRVEHKIDFLALMIEFVAR